jgi:hypothetical protein
MRLNTSQLILLARKGVAQLQQIAKQLEIKNEEDSKASKQESGDRDERTDVAIPPTRIVVESFPTPTDGECTYKNQKQTRERIKFHVEWITLLILAIYTGFTVYQVHLTKRAIGDNEESFRKTLCQMKAQTKAAQDAITQAREQFQRDQRPYIGVSVGEKAFNTWEIVSDGPHKGHLALILHYSNYGKSAGINVRHNAFLAIGDNAAKMIRWRAIDGSSPGDLVPPGVTTTPLVAYSDGVVTPEEFKDVGVRVPLVIFGHFEYTDMFASPKPLYTTEFCMSVVPSSYVREDLNAVCEAHTSMK